MNELTGELAKLSSAEEFLHFFAVPFDQKVINVSRLHILKRFNQYLAREGGLAGLNEGLSRIKCRELLARAATQIAALELGAAGNTLWVHGKGFATFAAARRERYRRVLAHRVRRAHQALRWRPDRRNHHRRRWRNRDESSGRAQIRLLHG